MGLMRTVSGIRGIVDRDLDAATVYRHARALADLLPPGSILLARDSRPHGQRLMAAAGQALQDARRQIKVAGLIPTPTAQFLVTRLRLAGALVITASHNPVEYNGLKFIGSDGLFLGAERCDILFGRADLVEPPEEFPAEKIPGQGLADAPGLHILSVLDLSCIDMEAILRHRCRVVVDAVNGATSFALPTLLEALGCEVIPIHTTPDGTFPRGAEPLADHLTDLSAAVLAQGAHLGMGTDPDGDRLALVDERGQPLGEEYTQVIAIDGFLRRTGSKHPIVTNLSSSQLLDRVAEAHGVKLHRSAVGEINVVNMMRARGSEIGGEGNGGVILAESHLGRDSLVGAALVLDRLSQERELLSEVVTTWPTYVMLKEKFPIGDNNLANLFAELEGEFNGAEKDATDGLKWTWKDRWLHVRRSNTEPVVRIIAEAMSESAARKLVSAVQKLAAVAGAA